MIKNKKGLSLIVTSLIIIVLVIVAIGIVWVVANNIIESQIEQIDYSSKCLEIDVKIKSLITTPGTNYNISLTRTGSNTDEIAGVKLVFFNEQNNSNIIDIAGNIKPLDTITKNINGEIENVNKIELTAYFKDDEGNEKLCSTNSFSF